MLLNHDINFIGGYSDRVAIEYIHQTTINHGLYTNRLSRTEISTIFDKLYNDDTTYVTQRDEFWKLMK